MIRLFRVYYPVRMIVLLVGEAILVSLSFLMATYIQFGPDSSLVLNYENGFVKIVSITILALAASYFLDLYDLQRITSRADMYVRLILALALISVTLSVLELAFPKFGVGKYVFLLGLTIVTFLLLGWRTAYNSLAQLRFFRENVYVLGNGDRAKRLVEGLSIRSELGMKVVGWQPTKTGESSREKLAAQLMDTVERENIDRIIVAMTERRNAIPVSELLQVRMKGIKIEEATTILERIFGKIEVDEVTPSWLIFGEGFRRSAWLVLSRRVISMTVAFIALMVYLPILPFIALAIKFSSSGPILYRQKRVGRNGVVFYCYKFRTMRQDAEADTGPTWAGDNDPRITRVGKFLRKCRLDEIPQLWNVFRGDMSFVGPRPERPEFVEWLSKEIPYYPLRHIVRPGLTGWAQIRYPYGNTVEDAKEKLKFDLFQIKNVSLGLDLLILLLTVKVVLLGRGAK